MSTQTTSIPLTKASGPAAALVARALADRLALAGLVGGLMVGMGLLVGALWPSLESSLADLSENLGSTFDAVLAGADMSTPSGWANAELMSLMAPAAVIAVAVISATKATAGEEEDKTLGLLLGAPVSRTTFLLAKAAAMAVHVLVVSALLVVGLYLGDAVGGLGLSTGGIIGAAAHVGFLGVFFGGVAITAGAALGARRPTYAVAGGLAGAAFALASFLPLADSAAAGAKLSPWHYYNSSDPLANGADPAHLLVLVVGTVAVLGIGVIVHRRRDLHG